MPDIVQTSTDPLWTVQIQILVSKPSTYGPAHPITAHGPDAETAEAYVKQQNPGCLVLGVTEAP